jgi:sensor histidine kinase YesM
VKEKLLMTALLTSPIIAVYGVSPMFLFNKIDTNYIIIGLPPLIILIFLFWLLNIYLTKLYDRPALRYFTSYSVTLFLHTSILFFMPRFLLSQISEYFILYPIVSTFAVNSIILLMINEGLAKWNKDVAESENEKLKVGNLEAQRQALLQQLHPHFLFNALSTLKSLIKQNPESAQDYSVKLFDFLRYSVEAHNTELVSVQDELQFTKDYLELQKVRFGDAFQCKIDVADLFFKKRLPVFALQTLVENALKHNAFTDEQPLFLNIQIVDGKLRVSNNRILKALQRKSGMGLKNLNERYKLVTHFLIEVIEEESQFAVLLPLL